MTRRGRVFIHCRDLFTVLGLKWNAKKVRRLDTVKAKVKDVSNRTQEQLFLLAEDSRRFIQKSTRTEKALWVMTEFLKNDPMVQPKLRRDALVKKLRATIEKLEAAKLETEAFQALVKRRSNSKDRAAFLVGEFDMPKPVREFVIEEYGVGHVWEERQRRNREERQQEEQKDVEIPDTLDPKRWQRGPVRVRWFEYDGKVWFHIDDFCNTMKYPRHNVKSPPRFHNGWFATHRSCKYINADVLRVHRLTYCSCQQKDERATWDHFREVTRRSSVSSSQNTSSST